MYFVKFKKCSKLIIITSLKIFILLQVDWIMVIDLEFLLDGELLHIQFCSLIKR